jgi:CO/xanthine dehydrogenase Mo-binding subunit/aerobic-type carbon monoxide dehydrogenase small subunit (CoxS/CutS family)
MGAMVGAQDSSLEISVNGRRRSVAAPPDTPLLYVLRNDLALNSVRFGCGLARCGACTVHVDGEPVRSCALPVRDVAGRAVVTLEGLGAPAALHPLQQAFLDEQAGQCVYCIPGIIMVAAHLLERNQQPTEDDVRAALNDTLCRCGAHVRIVRAVQRAASAMASQRGTLQRNSTTSHAIASEPDGDEPINREAILALEMALPPTRARSPADAHAASSPDADDGDEPIDTRLTIDANGLVTVYTGKVELGTGVRTALAQIVAAALEVPFACVTLVMGDTRLTPDDGGTTGSKTLQETGPRLQHIAAEVRRILLTRAAARLGVPVDRLQTGAGRITIRDHPDTAIPYGDLAAEPFGRQASDGTSWQPPAHDAVVGRSLPRVDLPAKLTGGAAFVHDLRLDGMLHGRVLRPRVRTMNGVAGAAVESVDDRAVRGMPGLVAIVRNGSFLGVVAEREDQAIRAAEHLRVTWSAPNPLPDQSQLHALMPQMPQQAVIVACAGEVDAAFGRATRILESSYAFPFQAHAAMGPSCAVADVRPDGATIYASSQDVFALRAALAALIGLDVEQVRVMHHEGAGCYGHNGADDVSADAALLSQAVARPVRVQWDRADEFAWEPKGPAMLSRVRAGLSATGEVIAWDYDVWTPTHSTRPGGEPGRLLAGELIDPPWPAPPVRWIGGDRNAIPNYAFPHLRVTAHWIDTPPLRPGSLRSLGGLANTTAIEGFVDELAAAVGADPVAFRLRHLTDPRALEVIRRVAQAAGWEARPAGPCAAGRSAQAGEFRSGRGIAFARYESTHAYVAAVAEVTVHRGSGAVRVSRVVVAHDCGLIVNPDGLANQIEGNVIQGISRALKEEVTWDQSQVTSLNWATYPILTFAEVPAIDIELVDRPDEPPWGAGEPAICPMAAAIGNAIFDAAGARLRTVPFTADRVLAAF